MKAWIRRHSDTVVIVVATFLLLSGVYAVGEKQNERRGETDVQACERGNVLRAYISFDNGEAILVLRSSLQGAQKDLSPREQRAREESLARRLAVEPLLVPYPCDTLK